MSTRDTEIRIYDRELLIWNDGGLPRELSIQALRKKHPSVPRNSQIAEIFYYAGLIEQWGGGTRMILAECAAAGMPEPVFEQVQGLRVTIKKAFRPSAGTPQVPPKYPSSTPLVADKAGLLRYCSVPRTIHEMLRFMRLKDRKSFVIKYIRPLLSERLLIMTDPGSPRSPRQRYFTR
jgi:ATP-dependent DNA helicase RecG